MKLLRNIIFMICICATGTLSAQKIFTYQNPISSGIDTNGIRDCQVLRDGNHWYMTATSYPHWEGEEKNGRLNNGVVLYQSDNLTSWKLIDYIVKRGDSSKWYYRRFWAPEIQKIKGKYYVTFNCNNTPLGYPGQHCGYAVADKITGPYTIVTEAKPLTSGNDLTLFEYTDGKVYAFWNRGREFGIGFAEVDLDKGVLKTNPVSAIQPAAVVFDISANGDTVKVPGYDGRLVNKVKSYSDWDAIGVEGAYVIKKKNTYYLFYSSWTRGYEIGYATSLAITGPWTKFSGNPFYGAQSKTTCEKNGLPYSGDVNNPFSQVGHNEVFKGPDVQLDTIATGLSSPWGFAQLPDANYLISDRSGQLYKVDESKNKTLIKGIPKVLAEGQGGLLDLKLHPQYEQNGWVYLSFSKPKFTDSVTLATTAIVRGKIKGDEFTEMQEIFEAQPYTRTRHHYGSKLMFDNKGYLFFSVGERGNERQFPQSTENDNGKIHRIYDDGRIPPDNPFVNNGKSKASIWSYGHRNPQGLYFDNNTGILWETEHGPRGGDELNIIRKGANYGWPVICNCINYNGKPITSLTKKEGMEQAETYWIPSIAPCGMTMINSDKYPAWKGNLMIGSLRFKYLNRVVLNDSKVVKQEKLFSNLGRMRNAEMGRDGYLYIAVENPGMVFRVRPL